MPVDNSQLSERLKALFRDGDFQRAVELYQASDNPSADADYWAACAFSIIRSREEAKKLLERSFSKGYKGSGALLAAFHHEDREIEQAQNRLHSIEPFHSLSLWDQAIAYREQGKIFEYFGEFGKSNDSYKKSWSALLSDDPQGSIAFGLIGQLLSASQITLGQSFSALEIIHTTKSHVSSTRKAQLLYLQVISASHVGNIDEVQHAVTELQISALNNPSLQGFAYQAQGVFAFYEGRSQDALMHFNNAATLFSGQKIDSAFVANIYLFKCHLLLDNREEAQRYLQKADDELIAVGPHLAPGYRKRAEAELLLRTGTLDVVLGRETAAEHLNKAREMFEELGLPVSQAQCWIQLSGWHSYNKKEDAALWCLEQAHALRKQFQDIQTFFKELDLCPRAKVLYMRLAYKKWPTTPEEEAAQREEFFPPAVKGGQDDPAAPNLERLFLSKRYPDVLEISRSIFVPQPASKLWMGLTSFALGLHQLAKEHWQITPEMKRYKSEFKIIHRPGAEEHEALLQNFEYLSSCFLPSREQAQQALLHFDPFDPLKLNRFLGVFEREAVHFSNPKTYPLFAVLLKNFKAKDTLPLEKILHGLWPEHPEEIALAELNQAISEINALGEKIHGSEFVVQALEKGYVLERSKVAKPQEAEDLLVTYWPLEIEEHLDQFDALSLWCLQQYRPPFAGMDEPLAKEQRLELEEAVRTSIFEVTKRYIDKGQLQPVMAYARDLVKLNPSHEDWGSEVGQTIKDLAHMLETTPHHGPGEFCCGAEGKLESEEAFRAAQEACFRHGWALICDELVNERAKAKTDEPEPVTNTHGLEANTFIGKEKPLPFKLICTGFVMEHEREAVLKSLRLELERHGIGELREID